MVLLYQNSLQNIGYVVQLAKLHLYVLFLHYSQTYHPLFR
jgi:hypothetical protein